jgi:hypothetical protein
VLPSWVGGSTSKQIYAVSETLMCMYVLRRLVQEDALHVSLKKRARWLPGQGNICSWLGLG